MPSEKDESVTSSASSFTEIQPSCGLDPDVRRDMNGT